MDYHGFPSKGVDFHRFSWLFVQVFRFKVSDEIVFIVLCMCLCCYQVENVVFFMDSNFPKTQLFEQNVNISKCFWGCHAPSIVIYNRKRLSGTRRGWRTFQGQFFRHSTTVRVVIVRTFSRNRIVRVVIVRCCPTKDRFPGIGEPLTSIISIS